MMLPKFNQARRGAGFSFGAEISFLIWLIRLKRNPGVTPKKKKGLEFLLSP